MKFVKGLILGLLVASSLHFWISGWDNWKEALQDQLDSLTTEEREDDNPTLKLDSEQKLQLGMSSAELEECLGIPNRKEPSAYGYEWWIYNQNWEQYIQIGLQDDKVVTFYTNAPEWNWGSLTIGMPKLEWQEHLEQGQEISFTYESGHYTFTLSEQDLNERPLMLDGKTAIQLYIDIHNEQQISGIRVMDLRTLLLHQPYALKYIGTLPKVPSLSQKEWEAIEKAYEQQVFDISNVIRQRYQLSPFEWHEEVAVVAKGHSQDMLENHYFDHVSPQYGELGERLEHGEIVYQSAGENIAWNYIDGPDAHEGWMNSLGHRKNLLKEEFTHLGVGVIEKYYTQNFLRLY